MDKFSELSTTERISYLASKMELAKSYESHVLTVPIPDLEILLAELEAKDERIGELEAIATDYAGKFQKAQDANKHLIIMSNDDKKRIAELEAKLATPVRLPDVRFIKVGDTAVAVMHAASVKEQIQRAGFKVEGDEQ